MRDSTRGWEQRELIVESIDVFMGLETAAQKYGIRGCRTHTYTGLAQRTHDDDLGSEKATALNHQLSLLLGNIATFS